jgi:predicted solute-binding protein
MELKKLEIKLFFEKVRAFLKDHWLEIGFALVLFYAVVILKQKQDVINRMIDEQQRTREANQRNINELTQQIEEEIIKRRKIESDYQQLLRDIQQRHEKEMEKILKLKEKEIKEMIARFQNNPEQMAQSLFETYGIRIDRG